MGHRLPRCDPQWECGPGKAGSEVSAQEHNDRTNDDNVVTARDHTLF